MEPISDVVYTGPGRGVRLFAWFALIIIVGAMVGILVSFFFQPDEPEGDPGVLEEDPIVRPDDLVVPDLVDMTAEWGLRTWRTEGEAPLRGGATLHDLDSDGDLDLVVAGGSIGLYEWTGTSFEARPALNVGDAVAVFVGDVDADGVVDLLVGTADGATVVWGGSWFDETSERLDLPASGLITAVIPLDLGTGRTELLVLGYGGTEPAPDLLLAMDGRRVASVTTLPNGSRKSMVAEIADVDADGLADIWIGRDVGWASGADSVYSRQGDVDGPWVDIAVEIGAALEIDAMGLTIADITGDGRLDAYLSDLGDNELLAGSASGFEKVIDVGAARIRAATADDNEISSSWASGAVDLNLDGRLDLVVANGGFGEQSIQNKIVNTFIIEDDPPAILLGLSDGTFYDAWPDLGLGWVGRSRGLALGDIDADGDTDIIIVDHGGRIHALRNDVVGTEAGFTVPPGCLAQGRTASLSGNGQALLVHQQSFLGAHAPEIRAALDAALVPKSSCEPG